MRGISVARGAAIAALGLVGLVAAGCGTTSASSGSASGGIGTPTTLAPGPTLSDLTSQVKSQVTQTGTGGFSVTGVAQVVCNPPNDWKPGATFTCYVYDANKSEIGEYDGTVEPDSASQWQWNGQWNPSPSYVAPTS